MTNEDVEQIDVFEQAVNSLVRQRRLGTWLMWVSLVAVLVACYAGLAVAAALQGE
jgi:hypothetical protein